MIPDDPIRQDQLRLLDITRDANYAFWNALLTFNAILISVFSAGAIYSSALIRLYLAALVLVSMVSAALLIANFRGCRSTYRLLGQRDLDAAGSLSPAEKERELADAARWHRRCNFRETPLSGLTLFKP